MKKNKALQTLHILKY